GDSLLFAAGAFAARGSLDPYTLSVLLIIAAIMGDTVNYWIGHALAPGLANGRIRFIKQRHLEKTQAFYDKHGGKTIIIARFVPIVRTFAPFVAGVGAMHYPRFLAYNVIGRCDWMLPSVWAAFLFDNIPAIDHRVQLPPFAITSSPPLAPIIEYIRCRRSAPCAGGPSVQSRWPVRFSAGRLP